ncbi:NAD-dependent epimerase/dehydratase family protein [Flavobacterium foetidum]|uniref:NAD-dependent epimerase/dehydratase family protein n=1 Tax=Flavobacterium foetidum TaxID=2026681 RepID=UPI0010758481|nr:NAD-dependent epimerase/dehydratase family protein [Flavobacterium foetidum]KAF2513541.1 NAD-dependent epimerase/dehydratase family protein [Flavobacterium foetidum]
MTVILTNQQRVIVTGISGFVGLNLQNYLKKAYVIKPLSVRYLPNQKISIKSDVLIHLAGKAHDIKKVSAPIDYYEANYELTKQLFDAFLDSEAKVFIFMSTVKAVADEVREVLYEETVPDPKTHYGISKNKAENYILSKEIPEGKRIYILRPCMIHGPGNKGNLNLLYQIIEKKIPWPLGAFENQRSFLSIENLCFVVKELLANDSIPSGIYQVADNKSLSTNELIKCLGKTLGKKSIILRLPQKVIVFLSKLGDVLHLPLNTERLKKLTDDYVVSNRKIVAAIGKPLPVSAEEGLKRTFISFKKQKK